MITVLEVNPRQLTVKRNKRIFILEYQQKGLIKLSMHSPGMISALKFSMF